MTHRSPLYQQLHFDRDMTALSVRSPQYEPHAHRYIEQVIRLASGLLEVGGAYASGGSVYFRGRAVAGRAGLGQAEAVRLAAEYGDRPDDPAKDYPLDVAVWQAGEPGHPAWDSPRGEGRPGWHAECAAMALSVFGVGVDIHAGGADLRFPHHACHAAMAEAFTGVRPYARAWLHVGTVTIDGAKMAKSAANLVLLQHLLAGHSAAAVRLMILDRRWGESWDYTPALLGAATERLEDLYSAAGRGATAAHPGALTEIRNLLSDDLDVPAALNVAIEAAERRPAPSPPPSGSPEPSRTLRRRGIRHSLVAMWRSHVRRLASPAETLEVLSRLQQGAVGHVLRVLAVPSRHTSSRYRHTASAGTPACSTAPRNPGRRTQGRAGPAPR